MILLLLFFWREIVLVASVVVAAVAIAASSVQIDGALIGGIGTLLVGIGTVVNIFLTARSRREIVDRVGAVQKEVTTMNSQTLADLGDADETRRIEAIPEEDRTAIDRSHMRSVEEAEDKEGASHHD